MDIVKYGELDNFIAENRMSWTSNNRLPQAWATNNLKF